MNITFMIGNGFDVGIGMKSCFTDYFPQYCEAAEKSANETMKALAEEIKSDEKNWSYFERQLGQYTSRFTKDTKGKLLEQLRDFEMGFVKYLTEQENNLEFTNTDEISKVMTQALTGFQRQLHMASRAQIDDLLKSKSTEKRVYHFISFNYTSVLEKCLQTITGGILQTRKVGNTEYRDVIGEIVHPHGYVDECPIMGVNDDSQIANKDIAQDPGIAKYLIKPETNKAQKMNFDSVAKSVLNSSDILCIYGMSLGETDALWWKRVMTWLNASSAHQLVVFTFDPSFSPASHIDWMQREDRIVDTFRQYIGPGMNMEQLRARIHLAVHRNIFAIDLSKVGGVISVPEYKRLLESVV